MIANPSSSLNTALRGGASATQPLTPQPAARSGATSAPASTEFSRMLENNQAAAREAQAATQSRQADKGAADAPADPATPPTAAAPANAAAPEQATLAHEQADASATDPAALPGDAARSARALTARDQAAAARTTRADSAETADSTGAPDALAARPRAEADAAPLPAAAGMPLLPIVPATLNLPTVTPPASAAAGDADAALAGVATGKPLGREAGGTVRADAMPAGDAAVPAASTDSAATADPSAVAVKAAAGRDQPLPSVLARELTERAAPAPEATPDAALAALARSALSESTQRTTTAGDATSPTAFGMALANVQSASAGQVSAPLSAQASVATPLTDPGFQQALGYQVSLLARDGIGQAELHLNPTDMGPVSVQITMTGDQARVDFGADLAQTRQLIEAGWAELASSLKDAGFTLSGGGVSDHARERQAQQGQGAAQSFGGRLARDSGEASAVATVAARRVTGGVDVYA